MKSKDEKFISQEAQGLIFYLVSFDRIIGTCKYILTIYTLPGDNLISSELLMIKVSIFGQPDWKTLLKDNWFSFIKSHIIIDK